MFKSAKAMYESMLKRKTVTRGTRPTGLTHGHGHAAGKKATRHCACAVKYYAHFCTENALGPPPSIIYGILGTSAGGEGGNIIAEDDTDTNCIATAIITILRVHSAPQSTDPQKPAPRRNATEARSGQLEDWGA